MPPSARSAGYGGVTGSRLLWSRHQIIDLLHRFIHEDHPVSVQYADENTVIVTRALQIDQGLNRVYFEYGDHKASNSKLLRSEEVRFSIEHGADKSLFTTQRVRDVLLEGKPVFHAPIPKRVVQTDRREYRRINIPKVSAPLVLFGLPDGREVRGRLADMSAGGIGIIAYASNETMPVGTMIRNCLIQLNDGKRVYVDLEVRHAAVVDGTDGNPVHRIGFRLASRPEEFSDLLNAFTVEL